MKPPCVYGCAWLTAVLLGIAALAGPAAAADGGASPPVQSSAGAPPPEIAPGGTVVLRGSGPANTDAAQPAPEPSAGSTGDGPAAASRQRQGWDTGGFDRRFDRSGLSPR